MGSLRLMFANSVVLTGVIFAGLSGCQTIAKGQSGPDYKIVPVSYIDSTGLYWLDKLEDDHKNGCVDHFGNYKTNECTKSISSIDDSEAEKNCELFGARLPSMAEYERLLKDFHQTGDLENGLSDETYHEVALAFKDNLSYAAWTSTVRKENPAQAYFFSWRRGGLQKRVEYRSVELPVRLREAPEMKSGVFLLLSLFAVSSLGLSES